MIKRVTRILVVLLLTLSLSAASAFAAAEAASVKTVPGTGVEADSRVVDAFVDLGFTVKYDKNHNYAGTFSVAKHAIIMRTDNKMNFLHEMGHFVSEINNAAGTSKEFTSIYKSEKKKYRGSMKTYITRNSEEYFAQSFAEYTVSPSALKKSRPKTYKYIKASVEAIDQKAIDDMYAAYSWAW